MRKILEDLYHGNLSVTERTYRRNSAYSQAMNAMTAAEDVIQNALPEDKRDLVDTYALACADIASITGQEDFITGFRMGARFILAALDDDDGSFQAIGNTTKDA